MKEEYQIGSAKILLDAPKEQTNRVILFLPGISGGAHSARFQPLVDEALAAGFAIARVDIWEGEADVLKTSPQEIFSRLDAIVVSLEERGYIHISGVGKSFGGGMLLACTDNRILCKVLWAPAIGYAEPANIEDKRAASFAAIGDLLELTVDSRYLARYVHPVCFVHGTADNAIPFANSEKLQRAITNSVLISIEGADHSYKNKEHEAQVIEQTISFITKIVR